MAEREAAVAEDNIRAPSAIPVDDAVLPFEVASLDVRGRLTKLGPALDDILTKHAYPAQVGKLLGEAIVLTTLLGSALKFDGRFLLQTQTDGPVSMIIVDFVLPDRLRGYSRWLPNDARIVILVDRDDDDCLRLKRVMGQAAAEAGLCT